MPRQSFGQFRSKGPAYTLMDTFSVSLKVKDDWEIKITDINGKFINELQLYFYSSKNYYRYISDYSIQI